MEVCCPRSFSRKRALRQRLRHSRLAFSLSSEARGRSGRYFGMLQRRLAHELELRGSQSMQAAIAFLEAHFITDINTRFTAKVAQPQIAFVHLATSDLQIS